MEATTELPPVGLIDLAAQRRRLGDRVEQAIARVIAHGRFILGPEVDELEARLAAYCGVAHAVTCASGTDALLLALMAWDVGPGDAVFVPAFTFPAAAEVAALLGATPVFVDVSPVTFHLDPSSLRDAVGQLGAIAPGLRPAGVIVVDLFGQPADYDAIGEVAASHGMWVLSDAAQSFGAVAGDGRRGGAFGVIATTSFFPTKPLGCYGDGGALFTDDPDLADRLQSLRAHGRGDDPYDHRLIGINGRLDTIQAAVLLGKLDLLDEELAARQRVADRYTVELDAVIVTPIVRPGVASAWAQYTIQTAGRDALRAALAAAGIASAVHYPLPVHHQPAYRAFPVAPGGLPVAEALASRVLSLPMHPYLDDDAQQRVVDAVRRAVPGRRQDGEP